MNVDVTHKSRQFLCYQLLQIPLSLSVYLCLSIHHFSCFSSFWSITLSKVSVNGCGLMIHQLLYSLLLVLWC
ncbi:hypothetical protein K2173_014835 [Erythroxylum novogranatense]|uniref:Uncharacterized protein n=1 Tax=Erythroxylum novogranatense TaxID=1862640 RepID=A0AAV8THG4_9ROSI|nr:hypothetical protein K2173_014835 [Erythroxylum novogranatense]